MAERPTPKAEVTRLLKQWREGRHEALELLLPLVYDELRRMARIQLSRERQRHTLQATELVHEAFVRLVDQKAGWQNLVDHARKKRAAKRPPAEGAVDLEKADVGESSGITTLLAVDQALNRIAEHSPRQAQIAELKMFGGLDTTEIAEVVGVSIATVKRDWSEAKKSFGASLGGGSRDSR
jgi:DNA-directed RNA polymerase specialized sigma24 family protein